MTATGSESRPGLAAGGHRYLLPLGEPLDYYRILRPLGVGSLGEVYLVEDIRTRKRYALRLLSPAWVRDLAVVERLQAHVEVLKNLRHPNLLEVYHTGHSGERFYLVMEYAEGVRGDWRTLEDQLREAGGRIRDEARIQAIALQIVSALRYAREQGVSHGDLQPANVLLARRGAAAGGQRWLSSKKRARFGVEWGEDLVRVMDWGLARLFRSSAGPDEAATSTSEDLRALGVLLYRMLTGTLPADPLIPPSRTGVSKAWDVLVARCLSTDPATGYADFDELLRELSKVVRHRSLRVVVTVAVVLLVGSLAAWQGPRLVRNTIAEFERRAELRRQAEVRRAQADILVMEARRAFRNKDVVEADVLVRRALDLVPGHTGATTLQMEIALAGELAEAAAQRAEAGQQMERLRQQASDDFWRTAVASVEAMYRDAEALWTAGNYQSAAEKFAAVSGESGRLLQWVGQRQAALREKRRAEQARWNARRRGAERDAGNNWMAAESLMRSAEEALTDERWTNAEQDWRAAAEEYAKAEQASLRTARRRVEEEQRRKMEQALARQRARWPNVPPGFIVADEEADPASGLPRVLEHLRTGYRLRLIPAGPFTLGSPPGVGNADEHPARRIYLDAYWIGETPVTCGQFTWFLNEVGNQEENGVLWVNLGPAVKLGWSANLFVADVGYESHPVVEISWYGARAFAQWMGGDLPTEVQWEKAAKGGRDVRWPWGDTWAPDRANTAERIAGVDRFKTYEEWLAWWEPYHRTVQVEQGVYVDTTVPVRSYPPNAYGLYDMAGNVLEWCLDFYVPDAYASLRDGERNPPPMATGTRETITYWRGGEQITETAECRVVRGGSWGYMANYARCAFRFKGLPTGRYSDVGFRVVVLPQP